ncbi:MAG: aspartate carbamoyltransferase regulatory subunit [Anaerostipes hadrus]
MNVDSTKNGIVLDLVRAGTRNAEFMAVLDSQNQLDCSVAIIKNVKSSKMGKKDIIKISDAFEVNFDVLGYIDPEVTVCVIENGSVKSKHKVELPEKIVNIAKCKNPRCITSVEQEIDHVFKLTDREHQVYRCIYCESKLKK